MKNTVLLVALIVTAVMSAACTYEVRSNGEIWACGTVQLLDGQSAYVCQPTGWRAY
jgi:hypothetical protein